jgi:two-component system, OmpR family, response regulator BaeR
MRNGSVGGRRRKILVVEDDAVIATAISAYLRAAGYEVDAVDDGLKALRRIRYASPDAIVLDLMLPGTDGWQVIESVRADGVEAAVVVVSARVSERDRVHALRMGADDYLCKPFGMPELVARVESALRRTSGGFHTESGAIEQPGLVIDSELKRVFVDGDDAGLTVLEFRLLHAMASEPGRALTRDQLRRRVWGMPHTKRDRSVDVCIRKLRAKLDSSSAAYTYIHTHPGVGYRFAAESKGSGDGSEQPTAAR